MDSHHSRGICGSTQRRQGFTGNHSQEIKPKVVRDGIFGVLVFCDNCQLVVASDVTSSLAIGYIGMDVHVKFGDSGSNRSQVIRAAHFVMDDDERQQTEVM